VCDTSLQNLFEKKRGSEKEERKENNVMEVSVMISIPVEHSHCYFTSGSAAKLKPRC